MFETSPLRPFFLGLCGGLLVSLGATAAVGQPLKVLAYETAPFFSLDAEQPDGLEWEILDYYARTTGRALEIEVVENFDELLPRLEAGDGDLVAATLTITPERQQRFDFSASYFPVRIVLVESKSRSTGSLQALAGADLATMKGTTYEEILTQVSDSTLLYGGTEQDLMDLVASGEARAAAMDSAVALTLLPRYPELHMTLPLSEEQHYGFAVRKGSPLAGELSRHIGQLKSSKIYFRLLEKYFGKAAVRMITAAKD